MNPDPKPTAEDVAEADRIVGNHLYLSPLHRRAAIERDIALALARVRGERDDAWASENAETARIAHELRDTLEDVISDRTDLQAKLDAQAAVIERLVAALEDALSRGVWPAPPEEYCRDDRYEPLVEQIAQGTAYGAIMASARNLWARQCASEGRPGGEHTTAGCAVVVAKVKARGVAALESAAALGYGKSGEAGSDA